MICLVRVAYNRPQRTNDGGDSMKQRLQGMVAGVLITVLLLSATMVHANNRVTREITYGVNVMLNGEMVQFDYDSRPFVMDGRTFLPLRTIADLVGLPVDFDPATNTAIVGTRPGEAQIGVPMFTVVRAFESRSYRENVSFTSLGVNYAHGARFDADRLISMGLARYNLGGNFTTITATLGHIDGTRGERTYFDVYRDGIRSYTFEVYQNMQPVDIVLNVTGVNILQFGFREADRWTNNANSTVGLGNVMIH